MEMRPTIYTCWKIVFANVRKWGSARTLKNENLVSNEGILLGNIVCKEGYLMDPQRIEAIQHASCP
jgi:hypothetical protein